MTDNDVLDTAGKEPAWRNREHDDTREFKGIKFKPRPGPLPGMQVWQREHRPYHLEPLSEPEWVAARDHPDMRPGDFVLGLPLTENAYALPWWQMKNHHVANLTLEERPFMITLCENCSSACAFDPVVAGRRLNFQVCGTYNGTNLLEDWETGSFWAPFTGECIAGDHEGVGLQPYPLFQCTWREWLELHPASLVPLGLGEPRGGHGSSATPGSRENRMIRAAKRDRRLRPQVLVCGVTVGGQARAYALDALKERGPVVNDELGGVPIALFSKPGTLLAIAFDRRLDGRLLSFEPASEVTFRDSQSGSEWDLQGRAIDGPLTGRRLTFVPSAIEEWYAFAAARSNVDIYEMDLVRAIWGKGAKA